MLRAMSARTLIVLNPRSRSGITGRRFAALEPRVRAALGPLEVQCTRGPRDAERIAREAARSGVERIVIAGGDGTTSEVVTGLLGAGLAGQVELALLPLGTGGDLLRTLGIPRDLDAALARIASGRAVPIDAGRAWYRDPAGREASSYFLNVASLGMSGLVTELVNRVPKWLGGRTSFLLGTLHALARWRNLPVRLRLDGELVHEGPLVLATAANGRYFGGGMHVAPHARPDDGLLDVVVVPDLPKLRLLASLHTLYLGTHLAVRGVFERRGRRLEAEPLGEPPATELDGEPLGGLPACYEVLSGAVRVVGALP
jgi:YegS/Rv2252/BmrU family lipid kinase